MTFHGTRLWVTILAGMAALHAIPAHGQDDTELLEGITQAKPFVSRRVSSAKEDLSRNLDSRPIEAGQTLTLAELQGPGVITHLWCTVASKDPFYSKSLVLRIYWDGHDKPSVEVPLGDFFAVGNAASAEVNSSVINVTAGGRSRSSYWRMPFQKSAKVTVTCESKQFRTDSFYYYLDWEEHASLPAGSLYFHARYNQDFPAKTGDYVVLDTEKLFDGPVSGQFAGVVYSAILTDIGWFGEGDDRFYVNGERYPSLSGTGTEDYFNDAWGFREFCRPYFGVPVFDGYMPGDRVTAYRWHLRDPVTFTRSLKFCFEHYGSIFTPQLEFKGQFHERADWLSSVAFWYQSTPGEFKDSIDRLDRRLAPYRVIPADHMKAVAVPDTGLTQTAEAITFLPGNEEASLEVTFDLNQPGRYQINALMTHSFLGGLYQLLLDGNPIGPVQDFQFNGQDTFWHKLDLHDLEPGAHVLRFESRGASPNKRSLVPSANAMALESLILLRLEDLDGYRQVLERVN